MFSKTHSNNVYFPIAISSLFTYNSGQRKPVAHFTNKTENKPFLLYNFLFLFHRQLILQTSHQIPHFSHKIIMVCIGFSSTCLFEVSLVQHEGLRFSQRIQMLSTACMPKSYTLATSNSPSIF